MSKKARFLTGSTMGHVIVMTLTGSLGLMFMFLVDVATLFWVSRMGVERLVAALGFAWTIQFFTVSVGIGLMIAATALVSRSLGRGDREEARKQSTSAMVLAFFIQCLVAGAVYVFRDSILVFAGGEGETLRVASRFLAISLPSLPFMAVGMVASATLRAEGDAWRSMMVTMSAGIVAMVIDPILIFGLGWGVDGAAIGVVAARVTSTILALWFVIRVHDLAGPFDIVAAKRLAWPFMLVAGPAIATQLSTPFGNYLVTKVISQYGDGAVAGWAVVSRLTVFAFGGIYTLSGAIGGIIGQNYGAGFVDRVRSTYRDALIFCLGYVVLVWIALILLYPLVTKAFALGQEGAKVLAAFTFIAAGGFVFTGFLFVSNAVFNNLDKPLYSTAMNWTRDGLVIYPACILLSGWYGAAGVVYGQSAAGVVVGVLAALWAWRFLGKLNGPERDTI